MINSGLIGIGLRQPHYQDFLQHAEIGLKPLSFVEVHTENFFYQGGPSLALIRQVRERTAISLHGVGLSLGSAQALDPKHLNALVTLRDQLQPMLVSEHLCWGHIDGIHHNDLLPMPFTQEALDIISNHVDETQNALKGKISIENVSSYLRFRQAEMSEAEFLAELSKRTGCGILLDVNNLYVNSINHGDHIPSALQQLKDCDVTEIHVAGHSTTPLGLIDDHSGPVSEAVWQVYGQAIEQFPQAHTLVEWDTHLPDYSILLAQAQRAVAVRQATLFPFSSVRLKI